MLTILTSIFGFIASAVPELFAQWNKASDNKHELAMLAAQVEAQKELQHLKIEGIHAQAEVDLNALEAEADIAETKVLYKTYVTGITWVDALNGTVRPVLAYAFFALYAGVKMAHISLLTETIPLNEAMVSIWTEQDTAIFAGIISFYYGQRAFRKVRQNAENK